MAAPWDDLLTFIGDTGIVERWNALIAELESRMGASGGGIYATAAQGAKADTALQPLGANFQTGTSYTVQSSDNRKVIDHANASAITVTLPNNFSVDTEIHYCQAGAGQITFSAASGATLRHPDSHTKTRKQWAIVYLRVRSNAGGNAAEWVLAGDTA